MTKYWFDKESDSRWSIMAGDAEHDCGEVGVAYSEEAARQFAAAPDLLAALKELAGLWEANKPHWAMPWPRGQEALDAAKAAIAKSGGKS